MPVRQFNQRAIRNIANDILVLGDAATRQIAGGVRDGIADSAPVRSGLIAASVAVVRDRDADRRIVFGRGAVGAARAARGQDITRARPTPRPQALRVLSQTFYQAANEAQTPYVNAGVARGLARGVRAADRFISKQNLRRT